MLRIITAFALALALLSGCGGTERERAAQRPAPKPAAAVQPSGPVLVYFRRVQGVDPLASFLIVHTNGTALAVITYGGLGGGGGAHAGGEVKHTFVLRDAQLRQLKAMIRDTRLRATTCCKVNLYIYWLTARNRSLRLQQGAVPRAERPLINDLNVITDAHTKYY
jgi:hypothetical protein